MSAEALVAGADQAIVGVTPARGYRPESEAECAEVLARYKAPRAFLFVDRVRRHPSGKADYSWARQQSADAVAVV